MRLMNEVNNTTKDEFDFTHSGLFVCFLIHKWLRHLHSKIQLNSYFFFDFDNISISNNYKSLD